MVQEIDGQQAEPDETLNPGTNFLIIKNWDKTVVSLEHQVGLEVLTKRMGFDLQTLVTTLTGDFPENMKLEEVKNPAGEKIEDVGTEIITVNDKPLDRLLVIAYPPAANPLPKEMTKFKSGGEVILITEGEAEITYAQGKINGSIARSDLKTEKVGKGDLIISTDTPNNWTKVLGDKFTFMYFVGNPNGPQKYGDIPKEKIPVI